MCVFVCPCFRRMEMDCLLAWMPARVREAIEVIDGKWPARSVQQPHPS